MEDQVSEVLLKLLLVILLSPHRRRGGRRHSGVCDRKGMRPGHLLISLEDSIRWQDHSLVILRRILVGSSTASWVILGDDLSHRAIWPKWHSCLLKANCVTRCLRNIVALRRFRLIEIDTCY